VNGDFSLTELSELFADIGVRLGSAHDDVDVLQGLTELTVDRVPGAKYASVTVGSAQRKFRTVAATDEIVRRVDEIQYELGHGPCVDAIVAGTMLKVSDLRNDSRWPEFGRRAFETAGICSMFSLRLFVEQDLDVVAGLNLYAIHVDAFQDLDTTIALLLATHGALAVGKATAVKRGDNLERALRSSRDIGIAMGVLMERHKITRDQAFDLLRITSQHTHRKLAEVARDLADTGQLPAIPLHRDAG
jgi:hypothetical protein